MDENFILKKINRFNDNNESIRCIAKYSPIFDQNNEILPKQHENNDYFNMKLNVAAMNGVVATRIASHCPADDGIAQMDIWKRAHQSKPSALIQYLDVTQQLVSINDNDMELVDVSRDVVRVIDVRKSKVEQEEEGIESTRDKSLLVEHKDNAVVLLSECPLTGDVAVVCPATEKYYFCVIF